MKKQRSSIIRNTRKSGHPNRWRCPIKSLISSIFSGYQTHFTKQLTIQLLLTTLNNQLNYNFFKRIICLPKKISPTSIIISNSIELYKFIQSVPTEFFYFILNLHSGVIIWQYRIFHFFETAFVLFFDIRISKPFNSQIIKLSKFFLSYFRNT